MDIETLTLFKLIITAGLAWLTYRQTKKIVNCQQQMKIRQEHVMLREVDLPKNNKSKTASTFSTSATSSQRITFEEYSRVYQPFLLHEASSDEEKNEDLNKKQSYKEGTLIEQEVLEQPMLIQNAFASQSDQPKVQKIQQVFQIQVQENPTKNKSFQNFMKNISTKRKRSYIKTLKSVIPKKNSKIIAKRDPQQKKTFMKFIKCNFNF